MAGQSDTGASDSGERKIETSVTALRTAKSPVRRRSPSVAADPTLAAPADQAPEPAAKEQSPQVVPAPTNLRLPEFYLNRELTWLSFNRAGAA